MMMLYFDSYSGVSGDMLLAALLDLGVNREQWLAELQSLAVAGFQIDFERTTRQGIAAQRVVVKVEEPQPHRHLQQIEEILDHSRFSEGVKEKSRAIFQCLAQAEARVHGCALEEVHFHEVGAVDAIVDVAGTCLALEMLDVEQIFSSPIGVGQGYANAAHGPLPLPAPATLEILHGVPLRFSGVETELATPTGAAILKTLAQFTPLPAGMKLLQVGYGAGAKVIPQLPNVLRAILLESEGAQQEFERALLLETNIDNLNPEIYPYVIERLLEAGALDAYLVPIIMKKGRPGIILSVLCAAGREHALQDLIYRETSTLGIRVLPIDRLALPRHLVQVETPLGSIKGKEARWQNLVRRTPEFEDCRRLARAGSASSKLKGCGGLFQAVHILWQKG